MIKDACFEITHNKMSLNALRIGTFRNGQGLDYDWFDFKNGHQFSLGSSFSAKIEQEGKELDFNFTSEMVPFVTERLKIELEKYLSSSSIQFLPIAYQSSQPLFILNILNIVECVNEQKSVFEYAEDFKSGKIIHGAYRKFEKMILNYSKIKGLEFFRIKGWPIPVCLTNEIKIILDSFGIKEIKYYPIDVI